MQIIPSFTAKYQYSKTPEERKYNILKETYQMSEGIGGAFATFAVLESLDKFALTKNKKNKTATELKQLAKSHTKRNALIALACGVGAYLTTWPWFKKTEPMQIKIHEWADKQNRIAEKAEQLVKEEDKTQKSAQTEAKETPAEE